MNKLRFQRDKRGVAADVGPKNPTARIPHIRDRLDAWGRWTQTGSAGQGSSPLANLAHDTNRFKSFVPIDAIECSVTDDAVRALPSELRTAVAIWHTNEGTLDQIAAEIGTSRMTLCRRLRHADLRISEWLSMRAARQAAIRSYNLN